MLKPGSKGTIKKFLVDCDDNSSCRFCHRLKEMGMHEGSIFEIISNDGCGGVTVVCDGTRIVLGRGMATKVIVDISNCSLVDEGMVGRLCRRFGIGCNK